MFDIVVIGGGAAGLAASICAAWHCRATGVSARIAVFETNERVGRSILATGNGRCNFSNAHITPDVYRNAAFVREVFAALEAQAFWKRLPCGADSGVGERAGTHAAGTHAAGTANTGAAGSVDSARAGESSCVASESANAVLHLFSCLGLVWREEAQGRLFPHTNKASTVLDVLRAAAAALGVQECCATQVCAITPPQSPDEPFTLQVEHGTPVHARVVICAVGGAAAQKLLPNAFLYVLPRAVLGPLRTQTNTIRALDNIRVRCVATLVRNKASVAREEGEVLFRSYGLSGIAIFNLSRFARAGDIISLDVLPQFTARELEARLCKHIEVLLQLHAQAITWEDVLCGMVLPLVGCAVLRSACLDPSARALPENAKHVAHALKHFELAVEGVGEARACQVHAGGFSCENFCAQTMESMHCAGLFAAGEMLDVDAPCGGYNLHWAWASGALAGVSAAKRLAGTGVGSTNPHPSTSNSDAATNSDAVNKLDAATNSDIAVSQGGCL